MLCLVVAYASNRCIGRGGQLPWRLSGDMKRFRELTVGHAVLMGRKTFQSLPDRFRPLPGRRNLVLSRSGELAGGGADAPAGAEVLPDLGSALQACGGDCFVIGGADVYEQALPFAERIYATEIDEEVQGDTFFPELERGAWRAGQRSERMEEGGLSYRFVTYDRVAGGAHGNTGGARGAAGGAGG